MNTHYTTIILILYILEIKRTQVLRIKNTFFIPKKKTRNSLTEKGKKPQWHQKKKITALNKTSK